MTESYSPYDEPPAPSRLGILIAAAALIVLLIAVGIGLWLAQKPPPFQVQGIVQTDTVRVSLKTTGRVMRLYVREGDRVVKGEVLATITSPEIDAALAQLKRAQAADDLAQSTWRRVASLYKSGVLPAQKRDEAEANAKAAAEAVSVARAAPAILMDGAKISADGGALDVLSPLGGEVSTREVNEGELAPAGYPMFTLIDPAEVWLTMNLREDQFHGLKMGQEIEGEVPALRLTVRFRVTYISPEGDFATWRATRQSSGYDVRSFEVRARPAARVEGLRPGMSVLIRKL
jgi:HlyD family secretion protein